MTGVESRLHALCRRNRLPHGLLFASPAHFPVLDIVLSVVRHLVCDDLPERKPCGECAPCRKIADQNHPDLLLLQPEKQELTIEQIREMQTWINRGPFEARVKAAIIESAEALNPASSNSLLKTLEEPPPYAHLFLLTHSPDQLLPTLLSRVQLIRFFSPGEDFPAETVFPPWWSEFEELLSQGGSPPAKAIFSLTEEIAKDRTSLPLLFNALERKLRDQMLDAQKSNAPLSLLSHLDFLFDKTLRAERDLVPRYGNIALILDDLFLRWFSSVKANG